MIIFVKLKLNSFPIYFNTSFINLPVITGKLTLLHLSANFLMRKVLNLIRFIVLFSIAILLKI